MSTKTKENYCPTQCFSIMLSRVFLVGLKIFFVSRQIKMSTHLGLMLSQTIYHLRINKVQKIYLSRFILLEF